MTLLFKTSSLIAAVLLLALAGCSRGIDKPLVTNMGEETYKKTLAEAIGNMDQRDVEAFNWAVSNLTIDTVNTLYPNQSPRQIIRGEVKEVLEKAPQTIAELETKTASWSTGADSIHKVVAEKITFTLEKGFFGLEPRIRTTVKNASRYGYSNLRWYAELYLDGSSKPVAVREMLDMYKDNGGLPPGAVMAREFMAGILSGDKAWTTLEVQNAKQRVVKLTVMPEFAEDFSEHLIVGQSPANKLAQYKTTLQAAQKYKVL